MRRREFLGAAAASVAASQLDGAVAAGEVVIVTSPADPIAATGPVKWATARLETALTAKGAIVRRAASISDAGTKSAICIAVAGAGSELGLQAQRISEATVTREAEALGILPAKVDN